MLDCGAIGKLDALCCSDTLALSDNAKKMVEITHAVRMERLLDGSFTRLRGLETGVAAWKAESNRCSAHRLLPSPDGQS
jgi:hypothetical protein